MIIKLVNGEKIRIKFDKEIFEIEVLNRAVQIIQINGITSKVIYSSKEEKLEVSHYIGLDDHTICGLWPHGEEDVDIEEHILNVTCPKCLKEISNLIKMKGDKTNDC